MDTQTIKLMKLKFISWIYNQKSNIVYLKVYVDFLIKGQYDDETWLKNNLNYRSLIYNKVYKLKDFHFTKFFKKCEKVINNLSDMGIFSEYFFKTISWLINQTPQNKNYLDIIKNSLLEVFNKYETKVKNQSDHHQLQTYQFFVNHFQKIKDINDLFNDQSDNLIFWTLFWIYQDDERNIDIFNINCTKIINLLKSLNYQINDFKSDLTLLTQTVDFWPPLTAIFKSLELIKDDKLHKNYPDSVIINNNWLYIGDFKYQNDDSPKYYQNINNYFEKNINYLYLILNT